MTMKVNEEGESYSSYGSEKKEFDGAASYHTKVSINGMEPMIVAKPSAFVNNRTVIVHNIPVSSCVGCIN